MNERDDKKVEELFHEIEKTIPKPDIVRIREAIFPLETLTHVMNVLNCALQEDNSGLSEKEIDDKNNLDKGWYIDCKDFVSFLQDCVDKRTIFKNSINL